MSKHFSQKRQRPVQNQGPRMSSAQKEDLILSTINQATMEEPLTFKGIAAKTELKQDEIRFFCDKLLGEKQINYTMIPDSFYPQQKVRAFFRKY